LHCVQDIGPSAEDTGGPDGVLPTEISRRGWPRAECLPEGLLDARAGSDGVNAARKQEAA